MSPANRENPGVQGSPSLAEAPPLRVLHVLPRWEPSDGGPAHSVPALCEALARNGVQVSLYSASGRTSPADERAGPAGCEFRCFALERAPFAAHLPHSPGLLAALRETGRRFDVIHVHSLWNPVASLAMRVCRQLGYPYCVSPRGMLDPVVLGRRAWLKRPWALVLERPNVAGARAVHFTSAREQAVAAATGWRFGPGVIAPNLLGTAFTSDDGHGAAAVWPTGLPNLTGIPYVLFAGRLSWVKNLPLLVEAFAKVAGRLPEVRLVLAGPDGEGRQRQLTALAERLGMAGRVHFAGHLEPVSLASVMGGAQVLALVSEKENFGLAALEALSVGTPVVLSEGVGLDVVGERPVVQRVETSVEPLATALEHALSLSPEQARLAAGRAREVARELADPGRICALLTDAYRSARSVP